jgi:hypothetical protein
MSSGFLLSKKPARNLKLQNDSRMNMSTVFHRIIERARVAVTTLNFIRVVLGLSLDRGHPKVLPCFSHFPCHYSEQYVYQITTASFLIRSIHQSSVILPIDAI